MTPGPDMLLAFDREVRWPESHGVLRRVAGPVLTVPEGETLAWFDPVDGEPRASSVVAWESTGGGDGHPGWFSTDRGVGCVVVSRHAPEVARSLEDFSVVRTVSASVRASMIHPLEVEGQVVGVAFHCGMGASTNRLHVGRDSTERVVAVLADLDLLAGANLVTR